MYILYHVIKLVSLFRGKKMSPVGIKFVFLCIVERHLLNQLPPSVLGYGDIFYMHDSAAAL